MDALVSIFQALGWESYTQTIFGVLFGLVTIASAISAAFPTQNTRIGKVIDWLALNIGKARNDPAANQ